MERREGSNKIPFLGDSQFVDAKTSKPLSPRIVSGELQLAGEEPNTTEDQNDVSTDVSCPSNALTKRDRGRPEGSQSSAKKLKRCIEMIQSISSSQDVTNGTDDEKDGDSEPVRSVMMRFDAVRRRLRQSGMVHGEVSLALGTFKKLNLYANKDKRVGSVPGVEVGEIFFLWGEMRVVGLHTTPIALDVEDQQEYPQTAISVVSSGSNADATEDPESLIFKGLGKYNDKPSYRHVKRLNRPLEIAHEKQNLVRVIRSMDDEKKVNGNIYIYDGLYLVTCMWAEEGDDGTFNELKFKLERQPDQKPGFAIWKSVDEWRYGLIKRPGLVLRDLSYGAENLNVPLVNEFNDGNVPTPFTYVTSLKQVVIDLPPLVDLCTCKNRSCGSMNGDCACVQRNGGGLPYLDDTLLVTRGPMVFECGGSCPCSGKCKNKMIQTGLKFKFEVFKTVGCGWGLRSWDPIRAGSFICEYAGDIISQGGEEEDDYIFDTSRVYKSFKWNYEPELVGEDASEKVPEQLFVPSSLVISAKKSGNVARFMNHSCSPNVFWQSIAREENGMWCTHIAFFAMRHIPPLTELTYDYGVSRGDKKKKCLCRSKKCIGSFG